MKIFNTLKILALFCLFVTPTIASERITEFYSNIEVGKDASLTVTETISIVVEGQQVRRGIYRDFPTDYRSDKGAKVRVGFDVQSVTRNGVKEPYRTERVGNGVRIYIGDESHDVEHGLQRYSLTYRTTGQLGHFDDVDELYWNVTGNGWVFPIARVRAIVTLPKGAEATQTAVYTGRVGEQGHEANRYVSETGAVVFETTRGLEPNEGITVAIGWPAGFVDRPTALEDALTRWFGTSAVWGFIGFLGLLGYYGFVWNKVGRDPVGGAIYPRYSPPHGFSPAAVRFISRMGYDRKALVAAIVNLAVHKTVRIWEGDRGEFTLERQPDAPSSSGTSPGERAIMNTLLPVGTDSFRLRRKNHAKIQTAEKALKRKLVTEYDRKYFSTNKLWLIPGLVISVLTMLVLLAGTSSPGEAVPILFTIAIWGFGCYMLMMHVGAAWTNHGGDLLRIGQAIFITLFSLPFMIGIVAIGVTALTILPLGILVMLGLIGGTNILFHELLKAPTLLGRKTMDAIEGFKLYLSVAEKDRLNAAHEPARTPELFEQYLPYAIALGVENEWGNKFADVLAQAALSGNYKPTWYAGSRFDSRNMATFGSAVGGALTGALAASARSPGSSSGSGGGGSSGGGGGGGGGGGW